jgi:tetratricopeptide (TPR) repeat protein
MTQAAERLSWAIAQHQSGNRAAAETVYRQLIAEHPQAPDAWHCLGVLCLQTGRAAEAIDHIGHAIRLAPNNAEYCNHLGAALSAAQRHDEAVATLRRAVQIDPRSASSHYNLGTALRNAGQLEAAVASFRHAVAADPSAAEAHYNLANSMRELQRLDEAEAGYRRALAIRPDYVRALVNLGNVLWQKKQFDESVALLRRANALAPRNANAAQALGTVLRDLGALDEAAAWLRASAALEPDVAETQNNLGTVLQAMCDFAGAKACYDRALALNPDLPDAHFSHATFCLRQGDLASGFAEYEWRWKCSGWTDRGLRQPRWDGWGLAGRTVLLYAEQGLGDTLQFVRYAQAVRERGGRTIVECQTPLLRILASCPAVDQIIALGAGLPPFDVHAPLMSCPAILGESLSTLEAKARTWQPYLQADAGLIERWRERLSRVEGLRVGICWLGNRENLFDAQRSFPLTALAPLACVPGLKLFNLQKGQGSEQAATVGFEVMDLGPIDEESGPFMDTAAIMTQLDLVITSDTSSGHLAGALGVPVWTALAAHADWRWMFDREDTPWYPTMRLFRQTKPGQWADVFERMTAEAERLARAKA